MANLRSVKNQLRTIAQASEADDSKKMKGLFAAAQAHFQNAAFQYLLIDLNL